MTDISYIAASVSAFADNSQRDVSCGFPFKLILMWRWVFCQVSKRVCRLNKGATIGLSCPILSGCLFRVASVVVRARRRPSASVTPHACPESHNALRLHRCPLFNNSFLITINYFLYEDTVQCFKKLSNRAPTCYLL